MIGFVLRTICSPHITSPPTDPPTHPPTQTLAPRPKRGKGLLFFPAFADGTIDLRMLHSGEPAVDEKWLNQTWIRQAEFRGISSKEALALKKK